MKLVITSFTLFVLSFAACSPVSKEAKQAMENIDCSTARQDMAVLEEEHASVGKQIATGVTNILPVGAVIRILRGQWVDGAQVAVGSYNKRIERKMVELSLDCDVPLPQSMVEKLS